MRLHQLVVRRGWFVLFSSLLALAGTLRGQNDADALLGSPGGWKHYDWLGASTLSGNQPGAHIQASTSRDTQNPFAVATGDALWQEKYNTTYRQDLAPGATFGYETAQVTPDDNLSSAGLSGAPGNLAQQQTATVGFQPIPNFKLGGNVHDSATEIGSPTAAAETRGAGISAEAPLPLHATLALGGNFDSMTSGTVGAPAGSDDSYDLQLRQPLGKLPLTAVLKSHYEDARNGNGASRGPSLDQSIVWKPAEATTVQMGLRQQQYQSFPGITNDLNEAVFADWSQKLLPEVSWHSYAELLTTRGTLDVAPAVPTASGANGTAQSADPANSMSLPSSFNDESITFSTGPSIKLDRDVSASVEYSNRIDHAPALGSVGQEQRVSVSLKGTF